VCPLEGSTEVSGVAPESGKFSPEFVTKSKKGGTHRGERGGKGGSACYLPKKKIIMEKRGGERKFIYPDCVHQP